MIINVPQEIGNEVVRAQDLMDWPDSVPGYIEVPVGRKVLFVPWDNLTVGHCTQAVERHKRLAIRAMIRWAKTRSQASARTAGMHIFRARAIGLQYLIILDRVDGRDPEEVERELPFSAVKPDEEFEAH